MEGGGVADQAGVRAGMLFHRLEGPDLLLMRGGAPALSFEALLDTS